ncbi:MAG: right-handed parallel beta-helix repeat-containing protein [Candidatus Eisenbacteria sp.]|nr:right-handed parallel beta-helix repeat-containing protein [Candidatus Eisenbacteria bacterium]
MTLCSGTYAIPDEGAEGVIRIAVSGVTLDCNNATLIGSDTGVGLRCDHNDVTITDGNFREYQFGIKLNSADRCSLQSCTVSDCACNGCFLSSSSATVLTDCRAEGNGSYGYSMASADDNHFSGCDATGNSKGYYLTGSTGNFIRRADVSENVHGIYLNNSQANVVWDNCLFDNDVNAYENDTANLNQWNASIGNYWDDFAANCGYPYQYVIDGPGDGIDWHPVGAVIVVRPDGTGDYPTIQAAIDGADDNSIIELTNGIFAGLGNRDLDCNGKVLWIRSAADDPDSCLINCDGTASDPHRGFRFHSGEGSETVLQGLTFFDGYGESDGGGAIEWIGGVEPLIVNCRFANNLAAGGGAIYCEGASPTFEDCVFESNWAATYGGALQLRNGSNVTLTRVTFDFNEAEDLGGAILAAGGSMVTLNNCTLHESVADQGGGIYVDSNASHAELKNTIVGFSGGGGAAFVEAGGGAHFECCDLYGNVGGDWVGAIAGQYGVEGNIAEDPGYCGAAGGDFTLEDTSPCAPYSPPNPACDQIGAWPVGCTGSSAITEPAAAPAEVFLNACRPNPLSAWTRITYGVPAGLSQMLVTIKIYDAAGHRVRTLVDASQPQGYHSAQWRGDDDRGLRVAGGIYFYQLSVGDERLSRRMILIR